MAPENEWRPEMPGGAGSYDNRTAAVATKGFPAETTAPHWCESWQMESDLGASRVEVTRQGGSPRSSAHTSAGSWPTLTVTLLIHSRAGRPSGCCISPSELFRISSQACAPLTAAVRWFDVNASDRMAHATEIHPALSLATS